jgi:hypothetical protein
MAYYCNQERTQELNNRIYERNIPGGSLEPNYDPRPSSTKFQIFPTLDAANNNFDSVPIYNSESTFNPGTSKGPWTGFSHNINLESSLRNQFFGLQNNDHAQYVPSSNSDLYDVKINNNKNIIQPHPQLFKEVDFEPFNPNCLGQGNNLFNNHTRQQLLDIYDEKK